MKWRRWLVDYKKAQYEEKLPEPMEVLATAKEHVAREGKIGNHKGKIQRQMLLVTAFVFVLIFIFSMPTVGSAVRTYWMQFMGWEKPVPQDFTCTYWFAWGELDYQPEESEYMESLGWNKSVYLYGKEHIVAYEMDYQKAQNSMFYRDTPEGQQQMLPAPDNLDCEYWYEHDKVIAMITNGQKTVFVSADTISLDTLKRIVDSTKILQ